MTRTDEARALGRQLRAARRLFADQIAAKVKAEELTDAEVADAADLFPDWVPGIAVSVGEVYRWDGTLVEVVQAHTTQADWTPDVVPALFKVHRTTVSEWVQPLGAQDAYQIGDRVTHNGSTWESTAANNVWAPGVYGWSEV